MSYDTSKEHVLLMKRAKVIESVRTICHKRGLPIPEINFLGCDEESDNLSHYHIDTRTICISEHQLSMINLIEVESIMAHEVSHMLVHDHGPKFEKEEIISKVSGWKPPGGIAWIRPNPTATVTSNKPEKSPINKDKCNYHLCKKNGEVIECKFCKRYYCDKHLKSVEPFIGFTIEKDLNGHPCPDYAEYELKHKGETSDRYAEALDRLLKHKTVSSKHRYTPRKELFENYHKELGRRTQNQSSASIKKTILYIGLTILIVTILVIAYRLL